MLCGRLCAAGLCQHGGFPLHMKNWLFQKKAPRVLVIRLSSIGDTILTSPAVAAIRDACPDARVDWVVESRSLPIVRMCRGVDRVFQFPNFSRRLAPVKTLREAGVFLCAAARLRSEMSGRRYDLALDFHGRLKSGVAALLAGADVTVGWRPSDQDERGWLFTDEWVPRPAGVHMAEAPLAMLRAIGLPCGPVRFPLYPPLDARRDVSGYLVREAAGAPVVVFCVGASKREKCWSPQQYGEVARRCVREWGALCLLTWCGTAEHAAACQAVDASGGLARLTPPSDLYTLAALLQAADVFVGGDTGPMQLAAALGTPVVALFKTTSPAAGRPLGDGHCVLGGNGVPITPEQVFQCVADLVERRWRRLECRTPAIAL